MIGRKNTQTDIVISGAGAPGLTLAILLARLGLKITVIDPHTPQTLKNITPEGRTSALMDSSINIIKATGAWDLCAPYGAALSTLRIIDDSGQNAAKTVDFQSKELGLETFGMNISNNVLHAALAHVAAKEKNIKAFYGDLVTQMTQDDTAINVQLRSGKTISATLMVAADGRNSPTRTMAGLSADITAYDQKAITCILNHTKPHDNVSTEFHRPSGPFTLVPMPGKQSSLVWVDTTDNIDNILRQNKDSLQRAIQQRTNNQLGEITLASTPQSWPLISAIAPKLTGNRFALIAEAAHVLHPMGAQGLNLSMRDVAALAEIIADQARIGMDIGSATTLAMYEKRRRHDIQLRHRGSFALNKLVSNHSTFLSMARKKTLSVIETIEPLKKHLMQQGLQDYADQGRLSQGQPL